MWKQPSTCKESYENWKKIKTTTDTVLASRAIQALLSLVVFLSWFLITAVSWHYYENFKKCGSATVFFSSPELYSGWAIVITFRPPSVRPSVCSCVRASVNIFKRLLWSRWANFAQISYGVSLGGGGGGGGDEKLLKWSQSVDQDGRHAHIW